MVLQVVGGLTLLAQFAALFLLLLGVMWFIFGAYEANRRDSWRQMTGIDDWDWDISGFLRFLTFLGFFVGIFCVIIGLAGLILDLPPSKLYAIESGNDGRHLFTSIFLIILGILTFMKPLNDIPISSIIGILVASAICILLAWLIPDGAVELIANFVNPKVVIIVIFVVLFAIVAITVKFYTAGLMFVSKIISWPPIAFIIGVFCFIQGFALLILGVSVIF